ncbi:Fic family protein [Clostridium sp. 'deep sea']|uniref:Fic family protein n=1 Tax=Clostridium sp. 'deep sea' TaxID=2779445 RepID=UPI0018966DE2|nr:Fic/DOC family N-terminal domain-containing protein [Clostridium sp. 'deep sea']QOR35423.1 Fic family protein [Clostridium sp. 'deep sea']
MKPFVPLKLPFDQHINQLYFLNTLVEASTNIGKFQVILQNSKINEDFLINPLILQEAFQSTKIEGTQATLNEVFESQIEDKKTNDVQEVLNYYSALKHGERQVHKIPICSRLFKSLHEILLCSGVRGGNRSPGEYRRIQNFIGPENCTIETAKYVPPEPQLVDEHMSNLENYINNPTDSLNPLVRIAIIHAQFETIHPFLDGNGRIGRILIPLYLYENNIINSPNFFISESLEKDKYKYYTLLNGTRHKAEWNEWILFFLESVNKQAVKNIKLINNINKLYEQDLAEAMSIEKNNNIVKILNIIFKHPIFNVKTMSTLTGINDGSCRRYLNKLVERKIIYADDKRRNKKYYYYSLLDLLRT